MRPLSLRAPCIGEGADGADVVVRACDISSWKTARTYIETKPRGVWSTGPTCHLGATLTALSASPSLRIWLSTRRKRTKQQSAIYEPLMHAAGGCNSTRSIDPRPALTVLEATGWKASHAQDAHETLGRILDILLEPSSNWYNSLGIKDIVNVLSKKAAGAGRERHDAVNPAVDFRMCLNAPAVHHEKMAPFIGATISTKVCRFCGHVSPSQQVHTTVFSVPASTRDENVRMAFLREYSNSEQLDIQCERCKRPVPHRLFTGIARYPKLLIIHLQRAFFSLGSVGATHHQMVADEELVLPRSTLGKDPVLRKAPVTYRIVSVVQHKGGATGSNSHFTAAVSQQNSEACRGLRCALPSTWWMVDDGHVRLCTKECALHPRNSYLLLYERTN